MTRKDKQPSNNKFAVTMGTVVLIALIVFIVAPFVNATGINILSAFGLGFIMAFAG